MYCSFVEKDGAQAYRGIQNCCHRSHHGWTFDASNQRTYRSTQVLFSLPARQRKTESSDSLTKFCVLEQCKLGTLCALGLSRPPGEGGSVLVHDTLGHIERSRDAF
jgi:hypothetical protein